MKRVIGKMVLAAAVLVPGIAFAGVALAPVMGKWNHDRRQIDAMLSGNRPFDQATVAAAIHAYVADATMVAGRIKGNSASTRDFADRFRHFAQTAAASAKDSGSAARFRPHFEQLMGECRSCHAIYN
jgi:cytochrome c556